MSAVLGIFQLVPSYYTSPAPAASAGPVLPLPLAVAGPVLPELTPVLAPAGASRPPAPPVPPFGAASSSSSSDGTFPLAAGAAPRASSTAYRWESLGEWWHRLTGEST